VERAWSHEGVTEVFIEKLVFGGNGMGTFEGKKVFVPFSAPGDLLDVEVIADHGKWCEAKIVSIITPSPLRVSPRCPVFGQCGGCQWQHLSYEAQLFWKREILVENLSRIGKKENPEVLETLPSPKPWNYRNRIQLHIDSRGRVGFYRQSSKEVIEFNECAIADERINAELKAKRDEFAKRDKGISLRVDPETPFAQVNSEQNEALKELLISVLQERLHEVVLELYAGSGNFTAKLARVAGRVIASDIDVKAVRMAKAMLAASDISNVEFLCRSGAKAAKGLQSCDAVILDPPRSGCDTEVLREICQLCPQSILCISCDPATLSRDALILSQNGYRLLKSIPIDMFPQTFHIESLSVFVRGAC